MLTRSNPGLPVGAALAFLVDNQPRQRQYYNSRRQSPSGCIVVHTAESQTDIKAADSSAEGVARFIQNRTDHGSYHAVSDRDSRIRLIPFSYTAFHVHRHNTRTIGVSVAMKSADWPKLSTQHRNEYLTNLVANCVDANDWLRKYGHPACPATRTKSSSKPGFISHGELDPGRRTDPGKDFPWARFLSMYEQATTTNRSAPAGAPKTMTKNVWQINLALADLDEIATRYDGKPLDLKDRATWFDELVKGDHKKVVEFFNWVRSDPKGSKDYLASLGK